MNKNLKDINQWETYADLYHQGKGSEGDELHKTLIQPILNKFLGNYSELNILDAGCGNGFLTKQLAAKARKVTGIDMSSNLLIYAEEHKEDNMYFKEADLTKRLPFSSSTFDVIISVMVLQYLQRIDVFAVESSRILKEKGKLIMIIDHPNHALFLRAQELAGKRDEKFINSGSYFKSGLRKKHSLWDKAILQYYHRPLSFYLNSFTNRFHLVAIEETTPDNEIPRILGCSWQNAK